MGSLRRRVLLSLGIVLVVFFGATVAVLEWSLGASLAKARSEVLEAQLLALIAAAEPVEARLSLDLPEPPDGRLLSPDSGLHAEIRDARGQLVWRSPSALDQEFELPPAGEPGVRDERLQSQHDGPGLALSSMTVAWEFEGGRTKSFRFVVAQSLGPWHAQRRAFRLGLVGWFGTLAVSMLAVLAFVLRAVLRPLGRIEAEIRAMESGRSEQLSARYPEELRGVATNLNALLRRERNRQQRYRESLANLAHSLKTPLAAIRALLAGPLEPEGDRLGEIDRELARMDRIISWQLRRAAAAGAGGVGLAPVAVAPVARDLATTLDKVYRHRQVHCELEILEGVVFRGAEGDLQEMLGNLMDNAWKYARGRVRCSAAASYGEGLELRVEDDGEGLDPASAAVVLARGTRLDESQPGQGIGLAVVNELAESYGGSVAVEASELGGAALVVRLPGHPAAVTTPVR